MGDYLERRLQGAIAPTDNDHALLLELAPVLHSIKDAFAIEVVLAWHVEAFRLEQANPHCQYHSSSFVKALCCADPPVLALLLELRDFLSLVKLTAAQSGVFDEQPAKFLGLDGYVARIVVDGLRGVKHRELPATLSGFQDERGKLPRPREDARRETGRASTHDDDIV